MNGSSNGAAAGIAPSTASVSSPWPVFPNPMKKTLSEPCNLLSRVVQHSQRHHSGNHPAIGLDDLSGKKRHRSGMEAFSFVIDSWRKTNSRIQDKGPEIERAVESGDDESLRSLCQRDREAISAAAGFAVAKDMPESLLKVLEISRNIGFEPEMLQSNRDGNGLLHLAARCGSYLCMELLLVKYKFMPNQWNVGRSATPMHAAAAGGQLVALKMLKDQGGDLECGSSEGKSVLHQAVRSNQVCIVAYLLENRVSGKTGKGFQETPLHVAAESNHHECARLLLEDNVLVDAMRGETNKETALHIAAANGYRETVSLLLTHDASPDNRNKRKESALHLAAKTHSIPVMQLLMNRGCDVDARDCDGRTPLHFAVNSKEKGGGECILLLSKKQAILDLRDGHGMTALHSAAFGRRYNRVRLLIKEGADLCVKNDLGKSALNFVMKYTPSCIRTIEERLDSGIKIDWTPPPDCDDASQYSNIVQMDFNIVIPSACRSGQSADSDVRLFHELLKINSNDPARLEKILMHPLSLCFLHLKWQQIRVLYYFLLLSHFIYSMTYSGYVVLLYATLCKPIEWMVDVDDLDVVGRFKLNMTCDLNVGGTKWGPGVNYVVALWSVLLFFTLLYLGKEVTKFLHLRKKYFHEWESVLNMMTIMSFPLISFHNNPFDKDGIVVASWQYHVAAIGIIITWVLNMFLVGKIPKFGKYVQMLIAVGSNFFNFFVAYFSLVIAFSLSFVVLFPGESSFGDFLTSPIKVLVMMTGELEYNDLYYPMGQNITLNINDIDEGGNVHGIIEDVPQKQVFPFTGHVLLAIFIVIVSIVIMNLLFGMAVSDVQKLYDKSRLHQSMQQVALISYMESILMSPIFTKIPRTMQRFLKRRLHGLAGRYANVTDVEIDSYDKKKMLPAHLNKAIKDICIRMQENKRGHPTLHSVQKTVNRLEDQISKLQRTLEAVARASGASIPTATAAGSASPTLSLASDDEETGAEYDGSSLNSDFTDGGGGVTSPSKRISLASMTTALTSLGQIREEETSSQAGEREDNDDASNA